MNSRRDQEDARIAFRPLRDGFLGIGKRFLIITQFRTEHQAGGRAAAVLANEETSGLAAAIVTQDQAAACGSETKLVINLLKVDGEEQVMLKVTVAEVQRSVLKQFGITLGAAIGLERYAEAEALLHEAHQELVARKDKIPARYQRTIGEAAQALADLYETLGKKDEAAQWRGRH